MVGLPLSLFAVIKLRGGRSGGSERRKMEKRQRRDRESIERFRRRPFVASTTAVIAQYQSLLLLLQSLVLIHSLRFVME